MKYLCILLFILIGCTPAQKQVMQNDAEIQHPYIIDMSELEISETPQMLSDFADSISYIRLSEEPLLPEIALTFHLYVDKNENIYIKEGSLGYKYNPKGEYIKSLFNVGQGPKEVILPFGDPVYNSEQQFMLVNNYGVNFKQYSLEGTYMGDFRTIDSLDNHKRFIASIEDKDVFYYEYHYPKRGEEINLDGPYLWYVRSRSNDSIIYKMPNHLFHIKATKGMYLAFGGEYPLYYNKIDSNLYMRHVYQDTIFRTTDALKWEPWYVIKHHQRDTDYANLMAITVGDMAKRDVEGVYQVFEVSPLPTGVLFAYNDLNGWRKDCKTGFCKIGEKALTCSPNSFKNDLDDCLKSIRLPLCCHFQRNGYLYVLISTPDFFEEGAKPPFPDLTEDSNPVLVKLKLKKRWKETN